jgi:hypothetical protein
MATEEIKWRLKFLATVLSHLHKIGPLGQDECCGLMYSLYDIVDLICPEDKKAGVE